MKCGLLARVLATVVQVFSVYDAYKLAKEYNDQITLSVDEYI